MLHGVEAKSLRALGLRDALDIDIFRQAKEANVILVTKDEDFLQLLHTFGPPPAIILVTCGNTSNARMREILDKQLNFVLQLIQGGEPVVEITGD